MRKFTIITSLIFASLLMLFITPTTAQNSQHNPDAKLKIYSGFSGGSYYQMAKDMQAMTRKMYGTASYEINELKLPKIDPATGDTAKDEFGEIQYDYQISKIPTGDTLEFMDVHESDGSYYNFLKINKVDIDVTFLQYDVLIYEDEKDLGRKFKKTEDIRVLLPMGSEEIHIITLRENNINQLSDLKKKRVAIGSSLQGTHITASYIKKVMGIKWIDADIPYDKAFRALFSHDIDAFFFVGKAPVYDLKNVPMSTRSKLMLIGLPENDVLKMTYGDQVEINSSMYAWVTEPVKTYAVKSLLVTSLAGQTPEKKEAIVKLLTAIKKLKDNGSYHEAWKEISFTKDPIIEWKYYAPALELYDE